MHIGVLPVCMSIAIYMSGANNLKKNIQYLLYINYPTMHMNWCISNYRANGYKAPRVLNPPYRLSDHAVLTPLGCFEGTYTLLSVGNGVTSF